MPVFLSVAICVWPSSLQTFGAHSRAQDRLWLENFSFAVFCLQTAGDEFVEITMVFSKF